MNITEDQIAGYLINNPDFFVRHNEVASSIQLVGRSGDRTISLHERQVQVLRDRIKTFERNLAEMLRAGRENDLLHNKIQNWLVNVLGAPKNSMLPFTIIKTLKQSFDMPQLTIKMWELADDYNEHEYALDVTENDIIFARSMQTPYCGLNDNLSIVRWLPSSKDVASTAILPLRLNDGTPTWGLLLFGSMDSTRFENGMSTDLLTNIAKLTSAMLQFMQKDKNDSVS